MATDTQQHISESSQEGGDPNLLDQSQDISITDGEGRPVDVTKISSIIAEENENNWIPTSVGGTGAGSSTLEADTELSPADGNTGPCHKDEIDVKKGDRIARLGGKDGGEQEDEDEDDMSSTICTDESPSPPLADVAERQPRTQEDGSNDCVCAASELFAPQTVPAPLPPAIPLICLTSGLSLKASPTKLKSWIDLSLTLDGRDKITKVCQYTARLLGWYYESLARSLTGSMFGSDDAVRALLDKAARLRGLQAKLTESRKAFRLGRSLVEMEKIRSMGWGRFLGYHLRHLVLSEKGEEGAEGRIEESTAATTPRTHRAASNVGWGPVTTIATDGTSTTAHHEAEREPKPRNRGPRLLLRRASTNIGWGPVTAEVTAPTSTASSRSSSARLYRSLSSLGQRLYRPLTSTLALPYDPTTDATPSTPAWKIIGSTLKLMGLMGFWLGDNVNFLGSSGILDDMNLNKEDRVRARKDLRRKAGHFAARAYFCGALSGLYVSLREVLRHRGGTLKRAVERVYMLEQKKLQQEQRKRQEKRGSWDMKDDDEEEDGAEDVEAQLNSARADLEKIKGRQFVVFLALLKVRLFPEYYQHLIYSFHPQFKGNFAK